MAVGRYGRQSEGLGDDPMGASRASPHAQYRRLRTWFLTGAVLLGAATVLGSVAFQIRAEQILIGSILSQARAHLREFEAVRRYVSDSGGVYVRESATVRKNPHLRTGHAPEIAGPDGNRYVLQNSPLVARGVSSLLTTGTVEDRVVIRMVQTEPLNPSNTPDAWEADALRRLAADEPEVHGFEQRDARFHFRYAYPITCDGPCVRCHPNLVGDQGSVFGATVVDMDVTRTMEQVRASRVSSVVVLIAVLSLLGGATYFVVAVLLVGLRRAQSRLYTLARTDELTGLPNRRTGLGTLENELARARREGGRLAVVLMDLDHFKQVNDVLGHAVGDLALQAAARGLTRAARTYDLVSRLGGEEFLVVLPGVDEARAVEAVERMRQAVSAETCAVAGIDWHVSLSAGIALLDPAAEETAEHILARADHALYAAKGCGRDRAVVSGDLCDRTFAELPERGLLGGVRGALHPEI